MNISKVLDPKAGGNIRVVIKLLTLAAVIVGAITASFPGLVAVASAGTAINALLGILTHDTTVGNVEG